MRFLRRKPSKKAEIPVYICPYCLKTFGEHTLLTSFQPKASPVDHTAGEKRVYFVG
jgi:hypothetical protein